MMYFMVSRCLEVDVQHYFRRPYGVHRELALPCLIARGPFECVTLQGRAHFGIGDLVEKDLQTVLLEVVDYLSALKRNLAVSAVRPFLLLLTHLAGKLGEFEDGVSLRDDRFLGLAVPFTDTGDGVVDNLHISVIDIRGELPDEPHTEDIAAYESLCERYNLTYAAEENGQVLFAASVAAWWLIIDAETVVTYMTQGDERVRAWHLSLEGLSYRKSEFPPELIPPIEWGCRCFLVANGFASVQSSLSYKKCIEKVDPVFRESLATGGKIFSPAHAYFSRQRPEYIRQIIKRIKEKFGYAQDNAR